jgi:nucleotide-binding universal stress UspA family protein
MANDGPILIAYDGSPQARAALARAATLFPGRAAVIVTVWEPGLAGVIPDPGGIGGPAAPIDLTVVKEVDDAFAGHAASVAADGAERAQAAGLRADAVSTQDDSNVAETLAEIADQRDASVVVVGSRGLSGLKARLLGSTSESVLHHCRRPVLVVREDQDED